MAGIVATFTKVGVLALGATRNTLSTGNDIDDDLAVVFAAVGAGAMRDAQGTAFALRKAHAANGVMTTAFSRLGMIATHSDYHISGLYRL